MSDKLALYTKAKTSHEDCYKALLDSLETNEKIETELAQAKEALDVAYLAGAKDYKDKLKEAMELLEQVDYEEGHGIDCHIPHSTWQKRKEQFLERNK